MNQKGSEKWNKCRALLFDKDGTIIKLNDLIEKYLDDRERMVLCYRFGLRGCNRLQQREVGTILGISRSYVSRIEAKAIETLKEFMPDGTNC